MKIFEEGLGEGNFLQKVFFPQGFSKNITT